MAVRILARDAGVMPDLSSRFALRLLTINIHKGVDAWSRRAVASSRMRSVRGS